MPYGGIAPKGVYYNEIEPYAIAWLGNLMAEGLIPAGDIDTRSIEDVRPSDLAGYVQCHFFAGIGGWPLALALAGWPSDRPVWTGSCPCQPFSQAGKGNGLYDERHLWPAWFHLISQCFPSTIFGEQVAKSPEWLALVLGDLEAVGYAVDARPIPANCAGADHERERLWLVADTLENGFDRAWISSQQWKGISCSPWRFDGFPWSSTPMPANAADFRDVLLLPDGVPGDLASIAAYGNAIVPQVAAEFIQAYAEARGLIAKEGDGKELEYA